MAYYKVVVVNEDYAPTAGVDVEAIATSDRTVSAVEETDRAGQATFTGLTGPHFFRPRIRRTSGNVGGRVYIGRIQVQVVAFGDYMNIDYVVDPDGMGTHTTLAAAVADAITATGDKTIWLCKSITESDIDIGGIGNTDTLTITTHSPQTVVITANSNEDIFKQDSAGGINSGGLHFINVGFSIPTANYAIFFGNTGSEIKNLHFDHCVFGGQYLARQAGTDSIGNIDLEVNECTGSLAGFYDVAGNSSTYAPDIMSAKDNNLALTDWWDGGSSNAVADTTRIIGGYYHVSNGLAFENGVEEVVFQSLVIRFDGAAAMFTTAGSDTSMEDLIFQSLTLIFAHDDGTFGNFGSNAAAQGDGIFIHGIMAYPRLGVTPSGTFLVVDTDWDNVFVGDLYVKGFSPVYTGPALADAHNILDGGTMHTDSATDGVSAGSIIVGNDTPKWDELVISVPNAGARNVLGIDNGETVPSWKGNDLLADADGDTLIQMEEAADEDIIRFDAGGTELMTIGHDGAVDIFHTAGAAGEHGLELVVDAAGKGNVHALDIVLTTGAIAAGKDEEAIIINIDQSAATGGSVDAIEVLATEGSATVHALEVGILVGPILQFSGTFSNMDVALVKAVDRLTEFTTSDPGGANNIVFFVADNDTITIGDAAQFFELEFLLDTVSSKDVKPKFEYSKAGAAWEEFFPADGTNGMQNSGVIAWEAADVASPAWAVHSGNYRIRITRTKGGSITSPIEDKVQIAAVTVYGWDKDADLTINSLALDATFSLDITASNPTITFDTNDKIEYVRASNAMNFIVGSTTTLQIVASQARLPVQGSGGGLLIGSDVQLYRSAPNVLYIPDSVTITGTLLADTLNEFTGAAGVTVEGIEFKDNQIFYVNSASVTTLASMTGRSGLNITGTTPNRGAIIYWDIETESGGTGTAEWRFGRLSNVAALNMQWFVGDGSATVAMVLSANNGQLRLPVSGSGAGLLLGGDALLYRSAADIITTPDSLVIETDLTVDGVFELDVEAAVPGTATAGYVREVPLALTGRNVPMWQDESDYQFMPTEKVLTSFLVPTNGEIGLTSGTPSTTAAFVFRVELQAPIHVTGLMYNITGAADNADNVMRLAIYTHDGADRLMNETDAVGTGTGTRNLDVTDFWMGPGHYYVFVCQSSGTGAGSTVSLWSSNNIFISGAGLSGADVGGTLTVTAGAAPATIDPTAITTPGDDKAIVLRLFGD